LEALRARANDLVGDHQLRRQIAVQQVHKFGQTRLGRLRQNAGVLGRGTARTRVGRGQHPSILWVDDVEVVDVVVPELVFVVELSVVVGVVVFVGVGVAADAVSDELELLHATKIQERPIPIKLVIAKLSVDVDRRILFSPKNEISLSREYVTQSCQVYVVLLQSKINTFIFD
ncbi:MAG: hypothetical protein RJA86_1059, partial [Pseudomonadota bacterium]